MKNLGRAVRNGDTALVQELLDRGADVNQQDHVRHMSPLMWAARAGDPDLVRLLLRHGADVTAQAVFVGSALHQVDDPRTAMALIEGGADVNARTKSGRTPMHDAASLGRVEVVSVLLDHGAEVDALTAKGASPLDEARQGAEIQQEGDRGPYLEAARRIEAAGGGRRQETIKEHSDAVLAEMERKKEQNRAWSKLAPMIQRGDADRALDFMADPERFHAMADDSDQLGRLLGLALAGGPVGTDPSAVDPLRAAVAGQRMAPGHIRIAMRLIELGADTALRTGEALNAQNYLWDPGNFPPTAVETRGVTLIGIAFEQHPFSRSDLGVTPLFLATVNDSPELVDALLAAGADPDARTTFGETPLHWSVLFAAEQAAEHLLTGGADANARTSPENQTPLDWARRRIRQWQLPPSARDSTAQIAALIKSRGGVGTLPSTDAGRSQAP